MQSCGSSGLRWEQLVRNRPCFLNLMDLCDQDTFCILSNLTPRGCLNNFQQQKIVKRILAARTSPMEPMEQACGLCTASLQLPLACHLLPKLDAKSLGSLACSCRAGRELVLQAGAEVWENAASQILPCCHPARKGFEVSHQIEPGSASTNKSAGLASMNGTSVGLLSSVAISFRTSLTCNRARGSDHLPN